jgi:hypothetical protein
VEDPAFARCLGCWSVKAARAFRDPAHQAPLCKTCTDGAPDNDSNSDGRTCKSCHAWQPWDNYSPSQKGQYRRHSQCKPCRAQIFLGRYRKEPLPRTVHYIDEFGRECTVCRVYKSWSEYNQKTDGPQDYSSTCRPCEKIRRTSRPPSQPRSTVADDTGRCCTRCNMYKEWSEYHQNRRGVNGRRAVCVDCVAAAKGITPDRRRSRWKRD